MYSLSKFRRKIKVGWYSQMYQNNILSSDSGLCILNANFIVKY